MNKKSIMNFIVFLGLSFPIISVKASIQVSPMNITLTSVDQYSGTVRVFSDSDETQYIKTSVKRIINPGTPQQKEVSVSPDEEVGIVVSPQRFILPRQSSHLVRILPVNIPKKEGVYRVYISSLPDDDIAHADNKEGNAQITINVIWGVLVYVTPEQSGVSLSYNATSGKLTNTGNVHVNISEYGFCQSENNCKWEVFNHSIYPEMSYVIKDRKENHSLFVKYQLGQTHTILKVN